MEMSTIYRDSQRQSTKSVPDDSSKVKNNKLERSVSMMSGLYFKRTIVDFGEVVVGSLSRLKAELCNTTDHMVRYLLFNMFLVTFIDDDSSCRSSAAVCPSSQ